MFVTTQSFRNVDSGPGGALPLEERFGLTMKHAGVTISITTLTSFIAFAIGATTVREGIINTPQTDYKVTGYKVKSLIK